tara:strand:- start:26693 stop:27511 length:819 start_codon:yes stop_codon:yes gene_type:complete
MSRFYNYLSISKQLFAFTILYFGASLTSHSLANASSLEDVFNAQINTYYSINGFYNFSANQGAQKDLADINESVDTLKSAFSSLAAASKDSPSEESFFVVEENWNNYLKLLKQNIKEVKRSGYPDLRLAGDMAAANIVLNNSLAEFYLALLENEKNKPNKFTNLGREAAVNIGLMMTKYSARSTSTVSQVYADSTTEVTIDALANEFDGQLSNLMDLAKEKAVAFKLLDSANTKWDFIKSSYINYNENRVNFIVNLYSKKIISDITEALNSK